MVALRCRCLHKNILVSIIIPKMTSHKGILFDWTFTFAHGPAFYSPLADFVTHSYLTAVAPSLVTMNVLATTGPFQHILGSNLDLCALLRLCQLFPLKLTALVLGGQCQVQTSRKGRTEGKRGRERRMSWWDTSGIVSKILQMILFLPSLLSPTSAEISSLL